MAHPKGMLIELSQKLKMGKPVYKTERTGPEHDPTFSSEVLLEGEVYGRGQGGSKREAERKASEEALTSLEAEQETQPSGEEADLPFEGPWPVFPEVLAAALRIADRRVEARLKGREAVAALRDLALDLYKGTLENLGEVIELEEEET